MGFSTSPSASENCILPGLQQRSDRNTSPNAQETWMQTLPSSEGCSAVFPTYENSVSSTVQYTTVALVFNTEPALC